jgi:hypothetical protein
MSSTGSIPPQGRRQTQRRGVDHVLGYSRRAFSKKAVNTEKVVVNEQLSEPCEAFGDPHLLVARSESQRTWRPRNYATRRNIMMRASIKRSLAARRHRAKIVVCKGGEDTRSAATTGAGASLRRDVVHDLTATRLFLFSSRGAAANDPPSDAGNAAGIDASGRIVMPEVIDIDADHRQLDRYGVSTNYNSSTAAGSTAYNEYVLHRFAPEYRVHVDNSQLFGALGQINEYAAYHYLWRHVNRRDRLLGVAQTLAMTCASLILTPLCILVAFWTKACL